MSIKIKYAADGSKEAEVELDQAFLQSKDNRDGYMIMHKFLTGVMNGSQRKCPAKDDGEDGNRPHNKSMPHFRADRRLATFIINRGGIRFLHGVNQVDKQQVFFFDRVPEVQALVEKFYENQGKRYESVKPAPDANDARKPKKKRHKKAKQTTHVTQEGSVEPVGTVPRKDIESAEINAFDPDEPSGDQPVMFVMTEHPGSVSNRGDDA